LAAVAEELLFRGVPLNQFKSGWRTLVIVLAFSAVFAAQHLRHGASRLGYRFGFGICFSVQFLIFNQLLPVIAAHLVGNWTVLLAARRGNPESAELLTPSHMALRM
jgi:membrane protease YdiL (CAAX protease family)